MVTTEILRGSLVGWRQAGLSRALHDYVRCLLEEKGQPEDIETFAEWETQQRANLCRQWLAGQKSQEEAWRALCYLLSNRAANETERVAARKSKAINAQYFAGRLEKRAPQCTQNG